MTKKVWQHQQLPTPAYQVLTAASDLPQVAAELGLPMIIKPPHEGSTLGVTTVEMREALERACPLAARYDAEVLAEQFIDGRELTVPLLGKGESTRALPTIEIIAPLGNYDYEHKYVSNDTKYVCPAELGAELGERVARIAEQAYVALGCEGWGRADFMLDKQGRPWLLEMNTSPGMTSHSLVPMGAKAAGMSYAELCIAILSTASCKVQAPPTIR